MIQHLDFLIWMLGFPLVRTINRLVMHYFCKEEFSKKAKGIVGFIMFAVWGSVGYLLY